MGEMIKDKLLCCDWGTTNFRLYCLDIASRQVIGIINADQGIASTLEAWKNSQSNNRIEFYCSFIKTQIEKLGNVLGEKLAGIPIVLSGMASSSIGMIEVTYQSVPFNLNNPNLSFHSIQASPNFPHQLSIYGGLQTAQDVMRGEEVQLLGLSHLINSSSGVCILPGTHSKHIWLENNTVVDFQTFMTGELFDLISKKSILKNSIKAATEFDNKQQQYFQKGLLKAQKTNFLNSLFSVRTNTLLHGMPPTENFHYLSGLLIGEELKALQGFKGQLLLNSANHLASIYQLALKTLQLDQQLTLVTGDDMEQCIPTAHLKLYNNI